MKTWSDISTLVKAITTTFVAVVAALAILWGWGGMLQTDAEAQEHVDDFVDYQKQQFKASKYDRVDRVQREIDRIDFQLLTDDLPAKKIKYLDKKRADSEKKIICIQRDEC
jgi:hypothetical protein